MNMKNKLFLATAILAFAACSENTYMGDQEGNANGSGAISFGSSTPSLTRAEGAIAAGELRYSFAVYGIKTMPDGPDEGNDPDLINVFAHNQYDASSNTPYWVWYEESSANKTQSNTYNWEYVGAAGKKTTPGAPFDLSTAQDIKYWDYSATNYIFTAYKNKSGGTVSNVTTTGFTFVGDASQFAGLYVADKLTITDKSDPAAHGTANNKIGNTVQFNFRSAAAKVRLGIYETIPGYNVMNVNFKPTSPATFSETSTSAQLSGSFNGGSPSTSQTFTVTYGADGVAQFATTADVSNNYVFGTFDTDGTPYLGETSTAPTWANASSDYISVLPNQDHTGNMVLSVDFDLYNTTTHETIHVEDANAVVPQMYMTWNPNYAYTYLFKICDNTNGYTGPEASPKGLYPITFDAVTVATTDGQNIGTITTVSTPAITTYQNGSVSDAGITYANAKGLIYITVNTDGTLATLNASGTTVKLYTVAAGTTEADLMLASNYAKTDVTTGGTDALTIQTSNTTVNSITFSANQFATFTPTANTTYAFEYSKDAVYYTASEAETHNANLTGAISTSTSLTSEQATTLNGLTGVSTTTYAAGNNPTAEDAILYNAKLTGAVSTSTVKTPAEKAYKVIQIVAAS